jgi:hypothetical protein
VTTSSSQFNAGHEQSGRCQRFGIISRNASHLPDFRRGFGRPRPKYGRTPRNRCGSNRRSDSRRFDNVDAQGSNLERRQLSDSSGNYVYASLPNGEYSLKAELAGFKTRIYDAIAIQVGQRINVDVALEVGAIDEEVTVTEDVSLMRTSNAEISEVIGNQRMADLPLNGRQFVQLTLLSDNVYLTPVGTRGAALAQTGRQVVIGGQRVGHNLYTLDGVSITDQYLNNLVISQSIDANSGIQNSEIDLFGGIRR